jgi:protein associated with RNAse G/E
MQKVTAQFLKNPHHIHWGFEAYRLGEDEWGVWLAVPAGTRRWKGAAEHSPTRNHAVFCAPREGWWHLHYNGPSDDTYSHFVDICTTPVWVSEDRYEMIDLDLDVARAPDGTMEIQDEDEFEEHQVIYGYTAEMIMRAMEETERVYAALGALEEPFGKVAADWLGEVVAHFTGVALGPE